MQYRHKNRLVAWLRLPQTITPVLMGHCFGSMWGPFAARRWSRGRKRVWSPISNTFHSQCNLYQTSSSNCIQ